MVRAVFFLLSAALAGAAFAHEVDGARFNQVELQASVSREVENDLMNATLFVEANDAVASRVADQLNRVAGEAMRVAKAVSVVKARSGNANTWPVYDRSQKLTGWRGRVELRLESRDTAAMAALIGKLQSTMSLGGVSFSVSRELRTRVEDELIAEAVAAFRARAEIAVKAMGGKGYKVRRLGLNTSGGAPSPRAMMSARGGVSEVAAPVFEAGTSVVGVVASGVVEVE